MPRGVFTKMTKKKRKEWAEVLEEHCGEDFWMDGEWDGTREERIEHLADWWGRMHEVAQQEQYEQLVEMKEEGEVLYARLKE